MWGFFYCPFACVLLLLFVVVLFCIFHLLMKIFILLVSACVLSIILAPFG